MILSKTHTMSSRITIVGQGLAGTCLAWRLWDRGKDIKVVDRGGSRGSSWASAGLVSPVIAYRLYSLLGAKTPRDAALGVRCKAFQRVTVVALSVTAGAALFSIVTYAMSSDLAAMTGVVTHVLLSGAIWPSRVRLESYLDFGPPWGEA